MNIDRFPEPPIHHRLRDIWVFWKTLWYLEERGRSGEVTIPAQEVRAFVRTMTLSDGLRDTVLRQLWSVRAIERLNTRGSNNRRYFITPVGQHLLTGYEELLERGLS